MSGGYGADGRGAGRGPGYGDEDYDGQGYSRPRRPAGTQPPRDDPGARGGQPRGRAGQRPGRGQGGQGAGQGGGQPYGAGDQGYGQPGGRPDPWGQGQRQPADAPRYPRGGQHRATDPGRQAPGGYDPRGAAPRRSSGGYPSDGYPGENYPGGGYPGRPGRGDPRVGQGDYPGRGGDPRRDEGLLPGFGGDDYDYGGAGRYPGQYPGEPRDAGGRSGRGGRRGRKDSRGGAGGGGWDDGGWDDGGTGKRRRGPVRRLAPWVALLVILTPIVLGGVFVYNRYEARYHPADYAGPGTGSVTVQVKSGDTASSLGPRLQALGVVASSRAFVLAAEAHANTTAAGPGLEAGFYKLHSHMQASLAWAALLNPKDRVQLTVTIPEGKRASQIVAILAKETSIPAAKFQQVIDQPTQLGLPSYAKGKVEGYLFPATYQIQPNDTAQTILTAMVKRFGQEATQVNLPTAAARVHMTPAQLIVVASLVQAEGGRVQDFPKIAEVVHNRLARGMKLQLDSTVFYGLGKYGTAATNAEISTPGPYNTYLNTGLPPGPIDSPGNAAIQAVLHPATGNLLYFFSFKNGTTEFSPNPIAH